MSRSTFPGESSHRTSRAKLDRHAEPSRPADVHAGRRAALPPWGDQNLEDRIPTFLETIFHESDVGASAKRPHDA